MYGMGVRVVVLVFSLCAVCLLVGFVLFGPTEKNGMGEPIPCSDFPLAVEQRPPRCLCWDMDEAPNDRVPYLCPNHQR